MPSLRVTTLAIGAAALLTIPAYLALGQPADPKPAPAGQPADAPKPDGAQPPPPPGQPGPDGRRGGRGDGGRGGDPNAMPQSVKQSMSIMNRGLRNLKKQVGDATKKEDNLKIVADIERGCLAAKALTPDRQLDKAPDQAKKDEMRTSYRKQLITLMGKLLKLETAIMDGKTDEANAVLTEIGELRDESHQMMGVGE